MQANHISNPNRIRVGEELQIWASPEFLEAQAVIETAIAEADQETNTDTSINETTAPEERVEYVVQPGEYLSQIANKFGVSWPALAEVNNITNPDTVYAGMTILIPNGSDILSQNISYATYNNIQPAATEPGPRIGTGREIVVVLSTQMTYAYEDGVLQHSALASTGLPATPTVQGDYKVWNKTRSQTMSGPGYYLENVEWVMYFHQGYGLHGTWWHENFGQPMSHGCVNLTNPDAKWFYDFGSVGTPVHVRFY
jgi:lipoprotein-anchoring transpeptidase ErfK/SrfK